MMNIFPESPLPPFPKPLGALGRDEMNLAEFPITLLTDRVPKHQKEAVYQDEIYDERSGRTLTRKLTIQAGNCGLTTAIDDEVILALIQITKQKNNFTSRKIEFTRLELIKMLGWINAGNNYERIKTSLDRWTSVYLRYENAWRDNHTKAWTTKGFHIIESFELNDSRTSGEQLNLLPSYIVWNEVIFESFQAGYLKPLDYDLCMSLSNSTAKRLYRFLDKRFHHKPDWTFDLKELAHEHIGLSRNYEGQAHLKRKIQPAIAELEDIAFLEPLPEAERYQKQVQGLAVRFVRKSDAPAASQQPALPLAAPEPPRLVTELVSRGVTKATAVDLVQQHPAEQIEQKIEVFDWMTEKQDKRIEKSPAGYLVKSIQKDYATPKGFISRAERQRQEEARQARQRQEAEARRRKQAEADREKAERKEIDAYWQALTPEEKKRLEADALAAGGEEAQRTYDTLKKLHSGGAGYLKMLCDDYIRGILQKRQAKA